MPAVAVNFKCPICAGTMVALPDDYDDTSLAACEACGATLGVWGQIKERDAIVSERAGQTIKEALSGIEDWNVKP